MNNTETLATLDTQDRGRNKQSKQGTIKNEQHRDTDNIWIHKTQDKINTRKQKGQSRMDNRETLATSDTQDPVQN